MEQQSDAIVSLLYESSMDSDAWSSALTMLADCLHAVGASYFVWDSGQQAVSFWCAVGHDEAMQERYRSYYAAVDPTRDAIMGSTPGEVFFTSHVFPKSYIDRSEYFQDYLLPGGIGSVFGGKTMEHAGDIGIFSVQQAKGAVGLGAAEHELLKQVAPHLARASKIHARLTALHRKTLTLELALQTVNLPIFLVDAARHVHFLNQAAELLLKSPCGIRVTSGSIICANPHSDRHLGEIICRATNPVASESGGVQVGNEANRHFLTTVPVPEYQSVGGRKLALIVGSPCTPAAADFARHLTDLFKLTLAERKLAYQVLSGKTVDEAAETLHLGRETIRSQLRSLFDKTNTSRQSQLMCLLKEISFISPREGLDHDEQHNGSGSQ